MKHKIFIVELDIPTDVTINEMRDHIYDAIKSIPGYHCAGDDIFYMDRDSVKVQHGTKIRLESTLKKFK